MDFFVGFVDKNLFLSVCLVVQSRCEVIVGLFLFVCWFFSCEFFFYLSFFLWFFWSEIKEWHFFSTNAINFLAEFEGFFYGIEGKILWFHIEALSCNPDIKEKRLLDLLKFSNILWNFAWLENCQKIFLFCYQCYHLLVSFLNEQKVW